MSSIPRLSMQQPTHTRVGHASDRYWRMPQFDLALIKKDIRELLEAHNYPHNGATSDFQHLLSCIARSLPGYEKCTTSELRRFVQDCHLHPAGKNRKQMVDALRHADSSPRFSHLMSLPGELRDKIYSLYCRDFADEPLTLPTNPPLARANKQLRKEVLPIFYSECTFGLKLTIAPHWQGRAGREIRMHPDTTLFFRSLSAIHLACIQKLDVDIMLPEHCLPPLFLETGQNFSVRVCVPRDAKKPATAVYTPRKLRPSGLRNSTILVATPVARGGAFRCPWSGSVIGSVGPSDLEREVLRFAKEIRQREGRNHLVLYDVYRLRRVIEDFFLRTQQ